MITEMREGKAYPLTSVDPLLISASVVTSCGGDLGKALVSTDEN